MTKDYENLKKFFEEQCQHYPDLRKEYNQQFNYTDRYRKTRSFQKNKDDYPPQ